MSELVRVGIGILIFNNKNEVLLGQRINAHGALTWAPPGGHLEFGESFEACAIREVYEETSLKIVNPTFYACNNDILYEDNKHYVSIMMQAQFPQGQEIRICEPDKIVEWKWFNIKNLPTPLFMTLDHIVAHKAYGMKQAW